MSKTNDTPNSSPEIKTPWLSWGNFGKKYRNGLEQILGSHKAATLTFPQLAPIII